MLSINISKPLLVIVGPTAVGKTELSLKLAEKLSGEIISADSRLIYKGMDIGTAKPTAEERSRVRHHLIDLIAPDEEFSLAVYQAKTYEVIDTILARGNLPIMVGGTGQYIHAVLYGWTIPPQKPDSSLRESISRWAGEISPEALYRKLVYLDPAAAKMIEVNNVRRTIRALEVIFGTGELFSAQRKVSPSKYRTLVIGLNRPRAELYQRVDRRINEMVDQGLVEEVRGLLSAGYSSTLPSLSAIGYREIAAYIEGKISLEVAVAQIKRLTRRYIRHQANWFKPTDPVIHWFSMREGVLEDVVQLVNNPENWKPAEEEVEGKL